MAYYEASKKNRLNLSQLRWKEISVKDLLRRKTPNKQKLYGMIPI